MDQAIGIIVNDVAQSIADLITNGIVIFLVCFIIGKGIKKLKYFKDVPNDDIPFICAGIGAILALLCPTMFIGDTIIIRLFKGLILGWASTGMYEMIRNRKKKKSDAE